MGRPKRAVDFESVFQQMADRAGAEAARLPLKGISLEVWRALRLLGTATMEELAKETGRSRWGISLHLPALISGGYVAVTRERGKHGGRPRRYVHYRKPE